MSERVSYWKAILETRLLPAGSSFGRSTYLCGGGGGEPARAHTLRSSVVASDRALADADDPTSTCYEQNLARH